MCSFQFNLRSKCRPRYFTDSTCVRISLIDTYCGAVEKNEVDFLTLDNKSCKLLRNAKTSSPGDTGSRHCSHEYSRQELNLRENKGKGLPQQAEVAQGVPGKLRPPDFLEFRHYKGGSSSAKRTVRLYSRRNPWYSFSEADSTSGHMV